MPAESKQVLKWVAIGTLILGIVGGLAQGFILAYWSGAKIEAKADRVDVPTLQEFRALQREYYEHNLSQVEVTTKVASQLEEQNKQLDRIEVKIRQLHDNGGP